MTRICLKRWGNLGDVLMTEPVGRYFRGLYDEVYLATNYPQARYLLGDTYDAFIPYDDDGSLHFDRVIKLKYEYHPHLPYLHALHLSAGLTPGNNLPRVKSDWPKTVPGSYVLLAPDTSDWAKPVRTWPRQNFDLLKESLETSLGIKTVLLESHHSFTDMLSLIAHCRLFIGNDSGPGIIAQCFGRPSLVIFGGTDPQKVLFHPKAKALFHSGYDCIGCKQRSRHTDIICASPLCLTELSVETVLEAAGQLLREPVPLK